MMRGSRVLILAMFAVVSTAFAAGDWEYQVGLYGWLAGLEGTIGVADVVEEPVNATFDDLLSHVDFAMAGHFEARGQKSVWLADVSYNGLGAERDAEILRQSVAIDMDIDQWIIELGGGYRLAPKVDLLVVGRYYFIDTGATFESVAEEGGGGSVSESWFDVFIGARYHSALGEKWFATVRADVGTGGSELAWFGQLALGYNISERLGATVGWRILSLDYEGDEGSSYFRYDVNQSGLGVSLGYRF